MPAEAETAAAAAAPAAENTTNTTPEQQAAASQQPAAQGAASLYDFEAQQSAPEPAAEESFMLEERFGVDQQNIDMLTAAAKEEGLPLGAAGRYMNRVLAAVTGNQQAAFDRQNAALRAEWGASFEKNMRSTGEFIARMAAAAGLDENERAALKSPLSYRIMYKLMNASGELNAGVVGAGAPRVSSAPLTKEEKRAVMNDMLHNPQNPYYKGLNDPAATPRERREAERVFNEKTGFNYFK